MNEMTDKQYDEAKETLILLILEMMKNSQNLDVAEEKVKALLPSKKSGSDLNQRLAVTLPAACR